MGEKKAKSGRVGNPGLDPIKRGILYIGLSHFFWTQIIIRGFTGVGIMQQSH